MPYCWSDIDKGQNICIDDEVRAELKGSPNQTESVQTLEPIPHGCTRYYFEVRILSNEGTDGVSIGLSRKKVSSKSSSRSKLDHASNASTSNLSEAPIFTPYVCYSYNDLIGCYVDYKASFYFFTMNGKILCEPITFEFNPSDQYYPTVDLKVDGAIVMAKFKEEECKFDVKGNTRYIQLPF